MNVNLAAAVIFFSILHIVVLTQWMTGRTMDDNTLSCTELLLLGSLLMAMKHASTWLLSMFVCFLHIYRVLNSRIFCLTGFECTAISFATFFCCARCCMHNQSIDHSCHFNRSYRHDMQISACSTQQASRRGCGNIRCFEKNRRAHMYDT